jgi:hypothetical protein
MTSFEQEEPFIASDSDAPPGSADASVREIYAQIEALRLDVMQSESPVDGQVQRDAHAETLEFLSCMSHEELLESAVEIYMERDALYRKCSQRPDLKKLEALRDQFLQAIGEIKSVREENEQLRHQLAGGVGASQVKDVEADGEPDWEVQKSQWMSRLTGKDAEEDRVKSVKVDQANGRLQAVIDRLNKENMKLKSQLKAELTKKSAWDARQDADEGILAERMRLKELQKEWDEKIKSGELELSRDRAEVTRKRAQLDERESRLQLLKEQLERQQQKNLDKPGGWRNMLGG